MENSGCSLTYKSKPSESGCSDGDYKYHYCFATVYQSHLYQGWFIWSNSTNFSQLMNFFDYMGEGIQEWTK